MRAFSSAFGNRAVLARLGNLLVVLTTGLHWAALQSVAWATMLAHNICTQSVPEAINHTFDGQHPCCLCKAIAAGKKSQKKPEAVSVNLKLEFPPVAEQFALFAPKASADFPRFNVFAPSFFRKPPVPPPRPDVS
jgi:hypothetical protein